MTHVCLPVLRMHSLFSLPSIFLPACEMVQIALDWNTCKDICGNFYAQHSKHLTSVIIFHLADLTMHNYGVLTVHFFFFPCFWVNISHFFQLCGNYGPSIFSRSLALCVAHDSGMLISCE